jgi:hypothetical protein
MSAKRYKLLFASSQHAANAGDGLSDKHLSPARLLPYVSDTYDASLTLLTDWLLVCSGLRF